MRTMERRSSIPASLRCFKSRQTCAASPPSCSVRRTRRRAVVTGARDMGTSAEDPFIEISQSIDVGDGDKQCDGEAVAGRHLIALLLTIGDGQQPSAGLIDVKGTLYGTTSLGGPDGDGTVFALKVRDDTLLRRNRSDGWIFVAHRVRRRCERRLYSTPPGHERPPSERRALPLRLIRRAEPIGWAAGRKEWRVLRNGHRGR